MRATINSLVIDRFGGMCGPTYCARLDALGVVNYESAHGASCRESNTWRLSDSAIHSLADAIAACGFFDAEVPAEDLVRDASFVSLDIELTDGRHRQIHGIVTWKPGLRLAAAIDKHLGIAK